MKKRQAIEASKKIHQRPNIPTLRSQENNPKTNSIKTPPTYPFQFHIQFSKTKIPAAPEPPKEARRVG
ncbi:hypothetical protein, partial [Gluconobacter wancherniae]|uniref:hypothetical protein n=1 Tax=Gluconobacter wancherniae TaxID=1307955 RepID=UPI001C99823E